MYQFDSVMLHHNNYDTHWLYCFQFVVICTFVEGLMAKLVQ